jgi:hypothetical protein
MYIEFYLPNDSALNFSTNVVNFIQQSIIQSVDAWSGKHGIAYRSKLLRKTLRITFDHDSYYTLFVTSWCPPQVGQIHEWWFTYRIVEPMSTRQ